MVLDFLYAHMTRPEAVLRHKWRDGDAVLWDNRATAHRGVGDGRLCRGSKNVVNWVR